MASHQPLKLPLLLSLTLIITALNFFVISAKRGEECSRTCESQNCGVAPLMRYGKYCGVLYSGCPGEKPCDGLDACCMRHDGCIRNNNNNYLNTVCSENMLRCVNKFKRRKGMPFKGNTCPIDQVTNAMTAAMNFALIAGRFAN